MRILFFCCLLLNSICSFSQEVFQNISFAEALNKARLESKLVMLQYESAECTHCNEVANKGFQNASLSEQLSKTFICISISPTHPDREEIGKLYNLSKKFGSLFIDANKTLIHSYLKTTTDASEFQKQIDRALTSAGESLKLSQLHKEYEKGNRAIAFLEVYMLKRKTLNLATDEILEEYVNLLPADSLRSLSTLQFIAHMAPVLGSKADEVFRKDQAVFNRVWQTLSRQERVTINTTIINKSRKMAIAAKNEPYALLVAGFAQTTYTDNPQAGVRVYEYNMLDFYKQTNDTTQYFKNAIAYYNRYYMFVNVDSVKRIDSINRSRLFAKAPKKDSLTGDNKIVRKATVGYAPVAQNFTRELNNAAYSFYNTTHDPYLLSIATTWIKRGLEFFETSEAFDTYSKLLYKQKKVKAAVESQQKAIDLLKKQGYTVTDHEAVLKKMKEGAAISD